jgi:PAS domain S-box-containing protein
MMITRTLISEYGIDLKNIINSDFAKGSFVASSRSISGQRPDGDSNLFTDKPKNSIGFSSDESILFCTTGAEEILGVTSASLIGTRVQQSLMPIVLREGFARLLVASRVRGNAQDEVRLTHDDGSCSQFIEIEMSYTKGSSDSSSGWLATITDITHKRTVETELLRAKKIEMLGVMSHGIAHSVADALTVIQSITGLTNDNKTAMEEIRTVAGNAGETIKQLLDYAGEHKAKLTDLDLVDLIKNRLEFFKQTVGDSCCIECTHHTDALPVTIDERTVLPAISHLLLNAKESYPSESDSQQIELEVDQEEISSELAFMQPGARAGKYARIRIRDHGEGISTEIFSKIFDPLYSSKSGHTGLGLSVVFAVMRAHDGFLTVESTPKKGTTVSLYFPLDLKGVVTPDTTLIGSNSKNEPNLSSDLRKALIIEDDDAVRRILELLLKQLGIATQSFISGEDVLNAEDLTADFFITDLILPGIQGTVVAERLIQRLGIPGLIATGSILEKSSLPKRTELLAKPYGIEELSLAIQKLKNI